MLLWKEAGMTRSGCALSIALATLFAASTAGAQTAASIDRAVRAGQKIVVVDDEGRELEGRVEDVSPSVLTLLVDRHPIDVPLDRIVKVDRPVDGLGNGALIGLATSAGITLVGMATAHNSCPRSTSTCSRPAAWVYLWAAGSSGAIGAAIGVGIDAMIRRDRGIYRRGPQAAIAPAIGRGARGAVVSVRW
jgi:hypothetical protein